jgi:amidase
MDTNADYLAKLEGREVMRKLITELMDKYSLDALVYPHHLRPIQTIAEAVPNGGATPSPGGGGANARPGGSARLSTVTGFPTVIVPAGFTPDGMPLGMEIFGRLFSEPKLIALAYAYEQSTSHRKLPAATPSLPGETFEY